MENDRKLYGPYKVMLFIYTLFVFYSFLFESPKDIWEGLVLIVRSPDLLITDYMELGGIGSALINCALVGYACIGVMYTIKAKPNGAIIMALWLTSGFSFFGKNIINIWPAMIGVWLFAKIQKEPVRNYSLVLLLSSALSPMTSQLSFLGIFPPFVSILFGTAFGVAAGVFLPTISASAIRIHGGYNLYNIGFSAGIVAMFFVAFAKSAGVQIDTVLIWGTGFNLVLSVFLYMTSFILMLCGFYYERDPRENLRKISKHPGRLVTDFYMLYGESVYFNMGILGFFATTYMLMIGADLNGPTLGGIFTIMGFGCFGKTLKNITPVLLGSTLNALVNIWDFTSPSNTLAILFSTCLAPIAGQYGWLWGIVAGFFHVSLALNLGEIHGGLNLYSNGFAGGFVAFLLVPIIQAFRKERSHEI